MRTNTTFAVMIVGSVAVMIYAGRPRAERPKPAPVARPHEWLWLTREATDQIIGPDGAPGPLFAGITVGGSAPSPEQRAQVAAFARANDIDISFEIVDDELAAIRFGVTFGGCCGYEGADSLARKLGRPRTYRCCGCSPDWVDDWRAAVDGVELRGRVRVNRVDVRWEPTASVADLLDRAESLVGANRDHVRSAARDRWIELEPQHYLLEVPFPFGHDSGSPVELRDDLGVRLDAQRGRIDEVSFLLRGLRDDAEAALRARWGRPDVTTGEAPVTWTWRTREHVIVAEIDDGPTRIAIRAR